MILQTQLMYSIKQLLSSFLILPVYWLVLFLLLFTSFLSTYSYGQEINSLLDSTEKTVESTEHISITGTRIKGIDTELSSPILMITREDIDESGATRLVDLLKSNTISLHSSRRESPGGTTQGQATVNLRGLGEQRTLVLINGHRIANSAAIPDAQNINLIPLSSIERIEILKDGASSIYGTDAIGGVVNIILRKHIQTNNVYLSAMKPKIDGGEETNIALYGGLSNNLTSVTYSFEHQKKSAIYARDVELTQEGLSQYGYPGSYRIKTYHPTTGESLSRTIGDKRCPSTLNENEYSNSVLEGDLCKYNFANFIQLLPESESNSALIDTDWQLSFDTSLYAHVSYTQNDSQGIYAPTPTAGGVQFLPTMSASNINNPTSGQSIGFDSNYDGYYDTYLEGPFDIDLYYRNELGELRTTDNTDKMLNVYKGLTGDVGEKNHYQFRAFYNTNRSESLAQGLVRRDLLQASIDSGEFDIFAVNNPTSAKLAKSFSVDSNFSALFEYQGASFTLNTSLFEKEKFTKAKHTTAKAEFDSVFGIEFVKHKYHSHYHDDFAGDRIDGRASGGSTEGERDIWSAFAESSYDFTKLVNLNLSLRYDNYSDLGSTLNPKVGLTYRYSPNLLVRASAGTGFRVPSLVELYKQANQSFGFIRDYKRCNASGDLDNNGKQDRYQNTEELAHNHPCQATSVETVVLSNRQLAAEESISLTAGFTYETNDIARFHFNMYFQSFENEINILSADELLEREDKYKKYNNIIRDETGQINRIIQRYDNFSGTKTFGIDLEYEYNWHKLPIGTVKWQTYLSASIFHKVEIFPGEGFTDVSGEFGRNKGKLYSGLSWKKGDWKARVSANFEPATKEYDVKLSSFVVTNLFIQKVLNKKSRLNFGVMNLFDLTPPNNNAIGWPYYFADDLYVQGRTLYLHYSFSL